MNNKKTHFSLLRRLDENPDCSQRQLANEMNVSLGKLNYCLKKLIKKGLVKVSNFNSNPHKRASYSYLLTPLGVEEKTKLTVQFLKAKMEEYDLLQKEIKELELEVQESKSNKKI